jgi:hypothetical protein
VKAFVVVVGLVVSGDGVRVVAHAGGVGLLLLADRTGVTSELSKALVRRSFLRSTTPDECWPTAVMLADSGEAIADADVRRHKAGVLGQSGSRRRCGGRWMRSAREGEEDRHGSGQDSAA